MKNVKSWIAAALLAFSAVAHAQSLKATSFEDQWEKSVELTEQTQWLVVSQSKDGGNVVKDAFQALQLKDLQQYKLLYIADISAMPSFVTKLFALPKMRDYTFQMALIKEENQLAEMKLPLQDQETVAVIALNKLSVGEAKYFSDMAALKSFLESEVIK